MSEINKFLLLVLAVIIIIWVMSIISGSGCPRCST